MQFSTKMIASFVALQGADSLGTSVALTEKEVIKTDTIDMMAFVLTNVRVKIYKKRDKTD
ncbi:MAG: hypothetical protein E7588_03100 [Ruminococcaceae bacterium]|nr:hypothetical protein [Oscillospiraceae bacterium]